MSQPFQKRSLDSNSPSGPTTNANWARLLLGRQYRTPTPDPVLLSLPQHKEPSTPCQSPQLSPPHLSSTPKSPPAGRVPSTPLRIHTAPARVRHQDMVRVPIAHLAPSHLGAEDALKGTLRKHSTSGTSSKSGMIMLARGGRYVESACMLVFIRFHPAPSWQLLLYSDQEAKGGCLTGRTVEYAFLTSTTVLRAHIKQFHGDKYVSACEINGWSYSDAGLALSRGGERQAKELESGSKNGLNRSGFTHKEFLDALVAFIAADDQVCHSRLSFLVFLCANVGLSLVNQCCWSPQVLTAPSSHILQARRWGYTQEEQGSKANHGLVDTGVQEAQTQDGGKFTLSSYSKTWQITNRILALLIFPFPVFAWGHLLHCQHLERPLTSILSCYNRPLDSSTWWRNASTLRWPCSFLLHSQKPYRQ